MNFRNWLLRPWFPYFLAAIVSVSTIVLLFQSIHFDRAVTNKEKRLQVSSHLNQIRAALEGNIYNNANLVRGLAATIATEPEMDQKRFASLARQLFKGRHQLRNIGAAPDLVIRLMYPMKGNEGALGLDFRKNEGQRKAALFAKEQRELIMAGPLELVQGGQAFIARLPVFIDYDIDQAGDFWGLISTVIDIQKLYSDSGLFAASGMLNVAIQGKDGTGSLGSFFYGDEKIAERDPVIATVSLPYGDWTMYAIPKDGWPVRGELQTLLIVELLIGGAFIVFSLVFAGKLLAERQGITAELDNQKFAMDEHAIVSTSDVDGAITYVNDRFCRVSGYSRDELLGSNHRIVKSDYHPGKFYDEMWGTISGGKVWHGEIKNKAKDGTYYWVVSTIVPFLTSDGKPFQYIAVRTDITADKENQDALEHAMAEAEVANNTKSEFLASMSHEIRTPMTSILGLSDMLLDDRLSLKSADKVGKIKDATTALLGIINDILDISKIEAGKLEVESIDFSPVKITNDVVRLFEQSCSETKQDRLTIAAVVADDFPDAVRADPTRLRQILINLVGNAVKFTDQGSVTLKCRCDKEHSMLHFEIVDTGIGIEAEAQEKLFEDFIQADASVSRKYQGTGLGLSICKRLVELMGGEIGLLSRLGDGSTFWFNMPYEEPVSDFVVDGAQNFGVKHFTGSRPLKILVAEDNEINQSIIQSILNKMGHDTYIASNGLEAIAAVEAAHFDLILMDVRMPEMSGPDATKKIRGMEGFKSTIPIIALTADIMADQRQHYFDVGMNDCVGKPIDHEELAVAINKVVGETVNMTNEERIEAPTGRFDLQETLDRLMLPEEVLIPLIQQFVDQYSDVDIKLQALVDENELHGAAELAHAVKGVSGTFGVKAVSECAANLERMLRAGETKGLSKKLASFSDSLTQSIMEMRKINTR